MHGSSTHITSPSLPPSLPPSLSHSLIPPSFPPPSLPPSQRLVCIGLKPSIGSHKPSLAIYEFDRQWRLLQYQMQHIKGLNYAHDFLLLDDYYVFHMTPFSPYSLKAALLVFSGWSSPGQLLAYNSDLPSRFVVVPRHAGAKHKEVRMFDTEPFHVSCF